jgi:hypothetical protein
MKTVKLFYSFRPHRAERLGGALSSMIEEI